MDLDSLPLTLEQTRLIQTWRNKGDIEDDGEGLTWRALAYTFIKYFPDDAKEWRIENTQPYGILLCRVAGKLLNTRID